MGNILRLFVALALAGVSCTGTGPPEPPAPPRSAPPSSPQVVTLTGLQLDQPGTWKADPKSWVISVGWEAPEGFSVDHYEVRRDGKPVADSLTTTSFSDDGVEPGQKYRYSVVAVDTDGNETRPASASITTKQPPLAEARLEGRFLARLHVTSQSGLSRGANGGGDLFTFTPRCGSGACDVSWAGRHGPASGSLHRSGASYGGTVFGPHSIGSCHGGTVNETLLFHVRLTAAAVVRGQWRATKIDGTLSESAASSGCVTGRISWSFKGAIQT